MADTEPQTYYDPEAALLQGAVTQSGGFMSGAKRWWAVFNGRSFDLYAAPDGNPPAVGTLPTQSLEVARLKKVELAGKAGAPAFRIVSTDKKMDMTLAVSDEAGLEEWLQLSTLANAGRYEPESATIESPLLVYERGMLSSNWKQRWVALSTRSLDIYQSTTTPAAGTKATKSISLLNIARITNMPLEQLGRAARPLAFAVTERPDKAHKTAETVLAAEDAEAFEQWYGMLRVHVDSTNAGSDVPTYNPALVLMQGPLLKLFEPEGVEPSWTQRFIVLTPTTIDVYMTDGAPTEGMPPCESTYLGEGASVEDLSPQGDVVGQPMVFAVVSTAGEVQRQMLLSANDEETFNTWITQVDRQCFITKYCEENKLSMDVEGNLQDENGTVITTAEQVVNEAQQAAEEALNDAGVGMQVPAQPRRTASEDEDDDYGADVRVVTTAADDKGLKTAMSFSTIEPVEQIPPAPPGAPSTARDATAGNAAAPQAVEPSVPASQSNRGISPPPAVDAVAAAAAPKGRLVIPDEADERATPMSLPRSVETPTPPPPPAPSRGAAEEDEAQPPPPPPRPKPDVPTAPVAVASALDAFRAALSTAAVPAPAPVPTPAPAPAPAPAALPRTPSPPHVVPEAPRTPSPVPPPPSVPEAEHTPRASLPAGRALAVSEDAEMPPPPPPQVTVTTSLPQPTSTAAPAQPAAQSRRASERERLVAALPMPKPVPFSDDGPAGDVDDKASTAGSSVAGVPTSMFPPPAPAPAPFKPAQLATASAVVPTAVPRQPPAHHQGSGAGLAPYVEAPPYSYPQLATASMAQTTTGVPMSSAVPSLRPPQVSGGVAPARASAPVLAPRTPALNAAADRPQLPIALGGTSRLAAPSSPPRQTEQPALTPRTHTRSGIANETLGAIEAASAAAARASAEVQAIVQLTSPLDARRSPASPAGRLTPQARHSSTSYVQPASQPAWAATMRAAPEPQPTGRGSPSVSAAWDTARETRSITASPPQPAPPQAPEFKVVPLREVRRVFDAFTHDTSGLLPLSKLVPLCKHLGVPLHPSALNDAATRREIDPAGHGVLNRTEFLAWWKRHTVASALAADDAARRHAVRTVPASQAPFHQAGAQREAQHEFDAEDDATALTAADTELDTATVSTMTQVRILEAQTDAAAARQRPRLRAAAQRRGDNASTLDDDTITAAVAERVDIHGPSFAVEEAKSVDDALAAVEHGIQKTITSAAAIVEELASGLPKAPVASVPADVPRSRRVSVVHPPAASMGRQRGSWLAKYGRGEGVAVRTPEPMLAPAPAAAPAAAPRQSFTTNAAAIPSTPSAPPASVPFGTRGTPQLLSSRNNARRPSAAVPSTTHAPPAPRSGYDVQFLQAVAAGAQRAHVDVPPAPQHVRISDTAVSFTHPFQQAPPYPLMPASPSSSALGRTFSQSVAVVPVGQGPLTPTRASGASGVRDTQSFRIPMPAVHGRPDVASVAKRRFLASGGSAGKGLGLSFVLDPAATASKQAAPPAVGNGLQLVATGAAPDSGLSLQGIVDDVVTMDVPDRAWNDALQRVMERPASDAVAAVTKAAALHALMGRFTAVAAETAVTVVEEIRLPDDQKSIPALSNATGGSDRVYLRHGILFRVAEAGADADDIRDALPADYVKLATSSAEIQRKVAGHELRGTALLLDAAAQLQREGATAATGALCTPFMILIDVAGYRVYATAVPPLDDANTLVYGKLDAVTPFVQKSPQLLTLLRRVGRVLHLKAHAVETLAFAQVSPRPGVDAPVPLDDPGTLARRTVMVPLSVDVQGHACPDGRLYVVNTGRLFPADVPSAGDSVDAVARLLRPELVRALDAPVSSDAFRSNASLQAGLAGADAFTIGQPPDADANDADAAASSSHMLNEVIPAFVRMLDELRIPVEDSLSLTTAMHKAGINVRYLGRLAGLTSLAHVREACEAEMVARVAKQVLHKNMRRIAAQVGTATSGSGLLVAGQDPARRHAALKSHSSLLQRELMITVTDLFNLVLGNSDDSSAFWREIIAPSVFHKFAYHLNLSEAGSLSSSLSSSWSTTGRTAAPLHKPQLFFAMQHHCNVAFLRDAAPLPPLLPAIAARSVGASADGISMAVASASKGVVAVPTSALFPADSNASMADGVTSSVYLRTPAIAPLTYAPHSVGLASSSAMPAALTAQGIAVSPSSHYDFAAAEPVRPEQLMPLRAAALAPRSPFVHEQLEIGALGQTADSWFVAENARAALQAYQLRVALLQAQGAELGAGGVYGTEMTVALLGVARAQLALGLSGDVLSTTTFILSRTSARHVLGARALLLRACALLLVGDEDAGLAVYAQAVSAATWHLGRHHPVVAEFAADVASLLSITGRFAASACLFESAADVATRVLGARHARVAELLLSAGHAYRSAAAAAEAASGIDGVLDAALRSGGVTHNGLCAAHQSCYLTRALDAYERAGVTLDAQVNAMHASSPSRGGLPEDRFGLHAKADVREGMAVVRTCMADVFTAQGRYEPALQAASRALELRRLGGAADVKVLQSLQQLAAIYDRMDRPAEALRFLEEELAALKAVREEYAVAAVQRGTRHAVRLAFRCLPTTHRAVLQHIVANRNVDVATSNPDAVAFVICRLFEAPSPSLYIRAVAARVLSATSSGFVDDAADEPALLDQLSALVSLLAIPNTAGGDVTSSSGAAMMSPVGAASSISAALRPSTGATQASAAQDLEWLRELHAVAASASGAPQLTLLISNVQPRASADVPVSVDTSLLGLRLSSVEIGASKRWEASAAPVSCSTEFALRLNL